MAELLKKGSQQQTVQSQTTKKLKSQKNSELDQPTPLANKKATTLVTSNVKDKKAKKALAKKGLIVDEDEEDEEEDVDFFNGEGDDFDGEDDMEELDSDDIYEDGIEIDDDDENDDDYEGGMGMMGGMGFGGSKSYLKKLRAMYPNLPEYYFKTPKEKEIYFQNLNKKYLEKLKKEKNTEKHSHKKKVCFNFNKNNTLGRKK